MARKLIYEIIDHGVDHCQYFQGCGAGEYDNVATGASDSARDAAADAFEQVSQDVGAQVDCADLIRELGDLPTKYDAHSECYREIGASYDARQMRKKPREWMITRQRPWGGEPAAEYVEISSGRESFSPGALSGRNNLVGPLTDPAEVMETALEMAQRFRVVGSKLADDGSLPIYFGSAEFGGGGEDDNLTRADLEKWADRMDSKVREERDAAIEDAHEQCELYHYVSIRYSIEEG